MIFFGNISLYRYISMHFRRPCCRPLCVHYLQTCAVLTVLFRRERPPRPCISNLVMKPFDDYMRDWCRKRQISYTRYCDDMTFSGSFDTHETIHKVSSFLLRLGFELNGKKTFICTRSRRQEVTGLIVNDHVQTSREYRRGTA